MSKRSLLAAIAAVGLLAAVIGGCGSKSASSTSHKKVAIALIAPISVLQDNINQFKAGLAAQGFTDGENISIDSFNAEGQLSNVNSIVTRMGQLHPNVVYIVGTPLVEAFAQLRTSTPIVFGAMTDPVGAKVVQTLAHPGGDATGTSDAVPPEVTFNYVKAVLPNVKTVGVIGNPSEENTVSQIDALKTQAKTLGIRVTDRPVNSTGDVASAIRSLGKVDALIVPNDATAVAALGTVAQTALQLHIPSFQLAGANSAKQGIMVSFGADFSALGRQAATQAAQILHGTSPGGIPVYVLRPGAGSALQLGINLTTARELGITIPASLRSQAVSVYGH
jgi:putative tryptophan/tyrosine transport system substrate-binding protein